MGDPLEGPGDKASEEASPGTAAAVAVVDGLAGSNSASSASRGSGCSDPAETQGVPPPLLPEAAKPVVETAAAAAESNGRGGYSNRSRGGSGAPRSKKDDYIWKKVLGTGSYSTVYLIEKKNSGKKYAAKMVTKQQVVQNKLLLACVSNEKDILRQCSHPNIVRLVETFQTHEDLCYVMEYAAGGELLDRIKRYGWFTVPILSKVTAEIVNATEYLHGKGVIHRDLKPENILLDERDHVKLVDFGTAHRVVQAAPSSASPIQAPSIAQSPMRPISQSPSVNSSARDSGKPGFCGTVQYLPPEVVDHQDELTTASDLWAVGCIVFQMAAGFRPFDNKPEAFIFDQIRDPEQFLRFPDGFPAVVKAFVSKLLVKNPQQRLGAPEHGGYPALKAHPLFKGVDFEALPQQELRYKWVVQCAAWQADEEATACLRCGDQFRWNNRKHHCRRCGQIFCAKCSTRRLKIPPRFTNPVRICDTCYSCVAAVLSPEAAPVRC
eukprot:Hpha_TRINITY_DN13474_c0_g1::TRINITY_DN13474_c0_g1_i1::g.131168::m.131168/K06276/PDPK1; 3-phosphoinositide dependent protein kinase-1